MKKTYLKTLLSAIEKSCDNTQYDWLKQTLDAYQATPQLQEELTSNIARARRRVGRQLLGNHLESIETAAGILPVSHWQAGDAARVTLLLNASDFTDDFDTLLRQVFHLASESEQTAIISGLSLYAEDDRFLDLSLEAGRTNSVDLFRAVATKTPYPAKYYDQHSFNQLVLKSLFIGVNVSEIHHLDQRSNRALSQMCEDYYDERTAAGRSLPADIWLALTPYASTHGESLLHTALQGENVENRLYAAYAMKKVMANKPDYATWMKEQLKRESDPRVKNILTIDSGEK